MLSRGRERATNHPQRALRVICAARDYHAFRRSVASHFEHPRATATNAYAGLLRGPMLHLNRLLQADLSLPSIN